MAKATQTIYKQRPDPEKKHAEEVYQLEKMLVEHKDTLTELLEVMDKLKEHEVYNMLNGALGQSEEILYRIVTEVDQSDTPQALKNILLMFDLLGKLDMNELEPVVLKLNQGIKSIAEVEHNNNRQGIKGLLKSFKDPEVIEGLNGLMILTKALGADQSDDMKLSQDRKKKETPVKNMGKAQDENKFTLTHWLTLSAGVGIGILSLPIAKALKKK
jgi:uncharacterized protein YjgD (DUF1641 family)